MKKTLAVLSFSLAILPLGIVSAQNRGADVERGAERRGQMMENMEERHDTMVERMTETRDAVAKRLASHTGEIINSAIERLEKIADRIDSRITKLKADNQDTTDSEKYLAEARAHLTDAKTALANYSALDISADKLGESFAKVRTVASEIKATLKEAHQSLMSSVRALPSSSNN